MLFCLRGFITSQCSFVVHVLKASLWSTDAPSIVLLFRFKVLQNATWFGLTGLKGNVMRVLCIDVINIILQTGALCFIRGFKHREIAFTVSRSFTNKCVQRLLNTSVRLLNSGVPNKNGSLRLANNLWIINSWFDHFFFSYAIPVISQKEFLHWRYDQFVC